MISLHLALAPREIAADAVTVAARDLTVLGMDLKCSESRQPHARSRQSGRRLFQRQRRCIFSIYRAGASGIRAELAAPIRRITPSPDPRAGSRPPRAWRG